jgi:hypothetical protein
MTDNKQKEPKFFKTIFEDLGQFISDLFSGEFWKNIKLDFQDIRDFFLDKKREKRLEQMGRLKRGLYLTGWLFKSLVFRLSSFRRVLLIISLILLLTVRQGDDSSGGKVILGILLLLFIILLELKDKLLARRELEAGRSVQKALAPDTSPSVPGWDVWLLTRPANDVGGDLVDYLKINNSRFGIAIGDVAGKGLPAALFMAKLQATLRALVPDFTSLSKLADKLNTIFIRDSLPNRFASLVYMELRPDSNDLHFVNAGHLPPILLQNRKLKELEKGAPALGIMPEVSFSERIIKLKKNDMFIVYSDGVTEARNEQGEFFGEASLKAILPKLEGYSAERAGNTILLTIDDFIGDARTNDDLSLVIVRRLE